jgi:glyoxylase-like metal-dependent hydrolase (beta-lactamase superfamily II)
MPATQPASSYDVFTAPESRSSRRHPRWQPRPEVEEDRLRARFPGQIADTCPLPEPLDSGELQLEGSTMQVIETGHTDALDSTSLHVRDPGLIVSGDVAYNHCHMYVGATTPESRAEWIAALDQLAAVNPAAVVAGHKDPTQGKPARNPRRVPRLPRVLRAAT